MAETVELTPGTRVRSEGKTFKVEETAIISGTLVETKAQKNRHAKLACQSAKCLERQAEIKHDTSVRVSNLASCQKHGIYPQCGLCGEPLGIVAPVTE